MLSYKEAQEMMKTARHGRRKLENNTWLEGRGPGQRFDCRGFVEPDFAVRLHNTDVVTIHPDGSYTLNSGGWRTVTTKSRLSYANASVWSDRGQWKVATKRKTMPGDKWSGPWETWDNNSAVPFADGMRIYPDGHVEGAGVDETAIRRDLLKQIRAYIDGFARHVIKNGLADPSSGDCWGCAMVPAGEKKEGKAPWGQDRVTKPGADHVMGLSHIFDHFQERYYVPSLYWRAVQRRGNPAFCYRMAQQEAGRGETRLLKDDLRAYFKNLMPALVAEKMREVERAA